MSNWFYRTPCLCLFFHYLGAPTAGFRIIICCLRKRRARLGVSVPRDGAAIVTWHPCEGAENGDIDRALLRFGCSSGGGGSVSGDCSAGQEGQSRDPQLPDDDGGSAGAARLVDGGLLAPGACMLEDAVTVIVGNAQRINNVPGRKADVKDAEWLAELLRLGLIPPSFVPDRGLRVLRDPRLRRGRLSSASAARWSRPAPTAAIAPSSSWKAPISSSPVSRPRCSEFPGWPCCRRSLRCRRDDAGRDRRSG